MVATLFNEGKAGMAISGPWFIGDIRPGVPWAVTSLPVVSATGLPAAPFLGAEGVLMSSRARDKSVAFAAMAHVTSDEAAAVRTDRARQLVPNRAAYQRPGMPRDPAAAAFRAQLQHSVTMPATPAMRSVWTPYRTALQRVIEQGDDPVAALAQAEREITGYLRGAGDAR
jgi:maltose-binding protein MalE